jgi:beta-mannosidase
MNIELDSNWEILQDVHDSGERLGLYSGGVTHTDVGHQLSEWEPIERLEHLQVALSDHPYWGRELRYFNTAPWWYRTRFTLGASGAMGATLSFSNVDYFCRVWLNGELLGEHEGYSVPFSFEVGDVLRYDAPNDLVVKVWSPWDSKVHGDAVSGRTFQVIRQLVKGTYEHDDSLIARDVNPVGIYGTVTLTTRFGAAFAGRPRLTYQLSEDATSAVVSLTGTVIGGGDRTRLDLRITDEITGFEVLADSRSLDLHADGTVRELFELTGIRLWNTWDQGDQPLYRLDTRIDDGAWQSRRIGFREVELTRTLDETVYWVNRRRLFIRGTSYFPDVYISTLTRERYLRDLLAIKAAGFNLVRVHVHVENEAFYELCDELGIAVMQDSEYNWTHPIEAEWADRLIRIYEATILLLDDHPSLITWICLNEPGVMDPAGRTDGYAMTISPGPRLFDAVTALDPSRAVIKGSFCFDDVLSGDSHNYTGSLEASKVPYTDIDGTSEKLNTEFGFDAPASVHNLRKEPVLAQRLGALLPQVAEVQHYQYRLLKYYLDHYRVQKYAPNSGYVQFMFIDLSPQSFYGVYDWWGEPKPGVRALFESNQPVAVLLEQTANQVDAVWLVNDTPIDLGAVEVSWSATDQNGAVLARGTSTVACPADSSVRVASLDLRRAEGVIAGARLSATSADGRLLARNRYDDLFGHPAHVEGHPERMSHELGMRIYSAE